MIDDDFLVLRKTDIDFDVRRADGGGVLNGADRILGVQPRRK